jgi:spoIIIJ-associated protein
LRQVDIQARSVEDAVQLALEQLGRTRDQVKVEVLATDPSGDEVLVRVTTQDTGGPQPQDEISPRARRGFPERGGGFSRDRGPRPGADQVPRTGNRPDRGPRPGGDRRPGGYGRDQMERPPRSGGGYDRFERPPRGGVPPAPVQDDMFDEDDNRGNLIEGYVPPTATIDPSLEAGATPSGEHATPADAVAPVAAEILQNILNGMRMRGRIARRQAEEEGEAAFPDDSDSLVLNVTGLNEREQSVLVGRRGETLDSLQFLLNLILGRKVDLWARVVVDVEGYRLRRKLALMNLARRTADQVQTRNQAIPLEAMPAYERRIIHMTLADHPAVVTESTGTEPERRVVVLPRQ